MGRMVSVTMAPLLDQETPVCEQYLCLRAWAEDLIEEIYVVQGLVLKELVDPLP